MSSSPISSLPPEVLLPIFSIACVDDGQTGCAINSVCNFFRTLCLQTGVDLQSASLCGTDKMKVFLETLRRRDISSRRLVSLLLTEEEQQANAKEYAFCVFSILRTIMPTHLCVLHVTYPYSLVAFLSTLLKLSFPTLLELHVSSFVDSHSSSSDLDAELNSSMDIGVELQRIFPRVTSLSIDSRAHQDVVLRFLRGYSGLPPQEAFSSDSKAQKRIWLGYGYQFVGTPMESHEEDASEKEKLLVLVSPQSGVVSGRIAEEWKREKREEVVREWKEAG
ncbi:hypothetical protein EIP91_001698 [Steccherinum ochraceum]|uniref:F-box domain-containing protein n=1 Tax=Steccherinum ochraceum TaxID=92696 RepID=A0A4R0RU47_9APHY|nr:hypothetical protein EIP91_001698 [Steccherinum ochraceum]